MRVLLLSAYAAQSHRYWRRGLEQMFPDWRWTVLELPPRYFSWRVRGNPLYWSRAQRDLLEAGHDLLIATSMVDLATLRGLVPPLARIPSLLYFHENQFAYPQHRQRHSLLEAQMVSLYSALAADALAFNSAYNRDTFLQGCDKLLGKLPDRVPPGISAALSARASVLPVPLLAAESAPARRWPGRAEGRPLRLLWSARFEHDKGGDHLLPILRALEAAGLDFELALTGQQFRKAPAVFAEIERAFAHRLVCFGYVESAAAFAALQREADLVLSTATHEFQGLAVLQAVAAGCRPVVPDRLAYREIFPAHCRYASHPGDPQREAEAAAKLILSPPAASAAVDVSGFQLGALRGSYRTLLEGLQDSQPGAS